eukprot:3882046-Prorocentrum_lima.AAC.1
MEGHGGALLRPLHVRAHQWSCRVVVIQTNRAGGTTLFRAAMAEVKELIARLTLDRRERESAREHSMLVA